MPRLWSDTIDAHRHDVREAILEATWRLAHEHGPLSITMSRIAETVGIGRATLYKYFPNVEAILLAHHEHHVDQHIEQLRELGNGPGDVLERLESVATKYALICYFRQQHGTPELSALVHRNATVLTAERRIDRVFGSLLREAAAEKAIRTDASPDELATFCRHALEGAGGASSKAAVRRLVVVTLDGLRGPT
jgi:AcrR family transcriptional regulator